MVDSGAVRSCVPRPLLDRLGIQPLGHTVVEYASGQKDAVDISYGIMFDILQRQTSDDALVLGDEVLMGQTVWKSWT